MTDNIDDDITCAKKIFKRHNFNAWYGWKNNCKGKTLPSVSECFWINTAYPVKANKSINLPHNLYNSLIYTTLNQNVFNLQNNL